MKTLKLLLCSFIALSLSSCNWNDETTGSITGLFLDYYTGEPVEGIIFSIGALGIADTTGVDGTFKLTDVIPGTYYFQVTSENYYSYADYISVSAGKECECMYSIKEIDRYFETDLEDDVLFDKEGGAVTIEYSTNVDFEVVLDEDCNWLTYELTDELIVLYSDGNDTDEPKTTTVKIVCEGYSGLDKEISVILLSE